MFVFLDIDGCAGTSSTNEGIDITAEQEVNNLILYCKPHLSLLKYSRPILFRLSSRV